MGANSIFSFALQWSFTGNSLSRLEPFDLDSSNPAIRETQALTLATFVSASWVMAGRVDLFVNNVTDERAIYAYDFRPPDCVAGGESRGRQGLTTWNAFIARPREFGVRFTKSW